MAHFQRALIKDVNQAAKAMKYAEIEAEIEDFLEGFNQATLRRHPGQWGPDGNLVIQPGNPMAGGPGTTGQMPSGSPIIGKPMRDSYRC